MPTLEFSIRSDVSELKTVTREVVGFLQAHHVPSTAAYFARLAIEELVVNVIRHAFDDGGEHEIRVILGFDDTYVRVRVEDRGKEFDPTRVPDPDLTGSLEQRSIGGWGVYLVRSVSDRMDYERDDGVNRVTVDIRLDVTTSEKRGP